jgi:hypothetical protein
VFFFHPCSVVAPDPLYLISHLSLLEPVPSQSRDSIGCTLVNMTIKGEYGTDLSYETRRALLIRSFAPLRSVREGRERCEEIDVLRLKRFATFTLLHTPAPSADEMALLERSMAYDAPMNKYKRVVGSLKKYPTVQMFIRRDPVDDLTWGKCFGDVDEAILIVLGSFWNFCAYERMESHRQANGKLIRRTDATDISRTQIVEAEFAMAPGISSRRGTQQYTWFKLESGAALGCKESYVIAFDALPDAACPEFSPNSVRATTKGAFIFEKVTQRITNVKHIQKADLSGDVPKWLMNYLVEYALSLLIEIQEKFRRVDRVVDKEMRDKYAGEMRESRMGLQTSGRSAYDACSSLKDEFEREETKFFVKPILSGSPFVRYEMLPAQKGMTDEGRSVASGRKVATGKAVADVDTCAEEAAAWIFDTCSRNRMRINAEENYGLPRIIVNSDGVSTCDSATLKAAPFPLRTREYVIRMSWLRQGSSSILVFFNSINSNVDYGVSTRRVVRGSTIGYQMFESTGNDSCSTALYQRLDFGGDVPLWVVNSKIGIALNAVIGLRLAFQRDEEIDAANRLMFAADLDKVERGESSERERVVVEDVSAALSTFDIVETQEVEGSTDYFVKFRRFKQRSRNYTHVLFEATVVVDTDANYCVPWVLQKASRSRQKLFAKNDGGSLRQEKVNGRLWETTDIYFVRGKGGDLIERTITSLSVWRRIGGATSGDIIFEMRTVVGDQQSVVNETQFSAAEMLTGGIKQTTVTMKLMFPVGASLLLERERLLAATRHLSELRKCFDKSVDIDRRARFEFCEGVEKNIEVYSEFERKILSDGLAHFELFGGQKAKTMTMASPTISAKMAHVKGESLAWGWSSASVRASAREVLALVWDFKKRAGVYEDDLERSVDETLSFHNQLVYVKKRTPKVIADRDFLARCIWRAAGGGSFDFVSAPEEHERRPRLNGVIRGKYSSALKLASHGYGETKVDYVIHPDSGGSLPAFVMNFYVRSNLAYVYEIQDYFQMIRSLEFYDEKDGAAVGERFMLTSSEERVKEKGASKYAVRVESVVSHHVALKVFVAANPWFSSLVQGMLSSQLRSFPMNRTKLDNLSRIEALKIGHSFSGQLRARKTAVVGTDVWINDCAALVELARRVRWFIPMAVTIGQRKIEQAPWGLFWKAGLGAVLSIADVATDIYAIVLFTTQGRFGFANAVIAMVSMSMSVQSLIVYANYRKRGAGHVAKEVLIVLSGFKPAVDAYRVISGAVAHVDDAVDPTFELAASKMTEW